MINPIVDIIYGGQFGSEGKRLFNEYYFENFKPNAVVSNFGPNSGGFVSDGEKWATFAFGASTMHLLSPGSIINLEDFEREIKNLPYDATIYIHENASVVTSDNIRDEKNFVNIGSTMTGTAEAAMDKMRRASGSMKIAKHHLSQYTVSNLQWFDLLYACKRIQMCIPQGHSLSLNHGFFPYCTSRNTSPQQGLADAGIPTQWVRKVIACMRTFPIRVSNRFDENGNMIGWSGPCYPDQKEMTWDEVGQKPEMTSVSKKVRRVFSFSRIQYEQSCRMNGVTDVFMNFANYLPHRDFNKLFVSLSNSDFLPPISWVGYGPTMSDIASVDMIDPAQDIDGRFGCHPTLLGIDRGEKE